MLLRTLAALMTLAIGAAATPAEAASTCPPFSGFSVDFGAGADTPTGESSLCLGAEVQAALNTRGQPTGLAPLDTGGRVPAGRSPQTADVSGYGVTPSASAPAGTLANLIAGMAQVALVSADRTGATAVNTQLADAIAIAAIGATELRLPAGTLMIDTNRGGVSIPSGLHVRGAGRGRTTIVCNDAIVQTVPCLRSAIGTTRDVRVSDLTVQGLGESGHYVSAAAPVYFENCTDCGVERVEVRYSRFIAIYAKGCDRFTAIHNKIYRSMVDGIAVWDSPDAIIALNEIHGANDDAISAHAFDTTAAPVRGGIVIADNVITESQGIRALGLKAGRISGNVLRRVMSFGIIASSENSFKQGDTPVFAVEIGNNVIADVFRRSEPNPRSTFAAYMKIGGGPRSAASAGSGIPGWPNGGGAIVDPFGTGHGTYYANGTNAANTATPGGGWFNVHDNILLRTLPAVTTWAQWGYGPSLYVGDNGDGSGFYAGAIPEAALNVEGIILDGPMAESRIAGNLIRTTGPYGIRFSPNLGYPPNVTPPPIADFDYDGLAVAGNQIKDTDACIAFATPGRSNQRISLLDNTCDGDPRFVSAGRGAAGTWANPNVSFGFYAPNLASTGVMRGNTFRNVGTPVTMTGSGAGILKLANIVYAHGTTGYAATNTGVGVIPPPSSAWTLVDEDGNPSSATFGWLLTPPTP